MHRKGPSRSPAAPARSPSGPARDSGGPGQAQGPSSPVAALAAPTSQPPVAVHDPMAPVDIGDAHVEASTEAGDFYCEHTLFSALGEVRPGGSITQGEGGALAGFLHLPGDQATYDEALQPAQADRHARTRLVVAAAMRGYFDQISLQGGVSDGEPFRILISGFGTFGNIHNNPTGDYVTHVENLTAAMSAAFGDALVPGEPTQVNAQQTDAFLAQAQHNRGPHVNEYYTATWRYQVLEPATCALRDVYVTALRMPVTDQAIDPSQPGSIQSAIREFGPQAVLAMGVNPNEAHDHHVETRADDGGLLREGGHQSHAQQQEPTMERGSLALANAIHAGAPHVRPPTSPVAGATPP